MCARSSLAYPRRSDITRQCDQLPWRLVPRCANNESGGARCWVSACAAGPAKDATDRVAGPSVGGASHADHNYLISTQFGAETRELRTIRSKSLPVKFLRITPWESSFWRDFFAKLLIPGKAQRGRVISCVLLRPEMGNLGERVRVCKLVNIAAPRGREIVTESYATSSFRVEVVAVSPIDTVREAAYSKLCDFRFLLDRRTSNHYAFIASLSAVFGGGPTSARSGERGGNPGRRPGRARGRHDALAARLGHLHPQAGRHPGDALRAARTAIGTAQVDGLADHPRLYHAWPRDGAGRPCPALLGQRRHGRAYHRRREEGRGPGLGACP